MENIKTVEQALEFSDKCPLGFFTIGFYRQAVKILATEVRESKENRLLVKSYLEALATCSELHKDGFTIVDFQRVWLEQEQSKNAKLQEENKELKAEIAKIWEQKHTGG